MEKEIRYLAKCDEFVLARYNFNIETAKLLFSMLFKMNSPHVKPTQFIEDNRIIQHRFILNFEELKELSGFNYDLENDKRIVDRILKDMTSKVIILEEGHIKEFTTLIIQPRIDNIEKKMYFGISDLAKRYLFDEFTTRKLTKYNFEHIMFCTSKYSIRLYEILLMKANKIKDKQNIMFDFTFTIEELYDILQLGNYKYSQFKERVLEKSKKDFLALERSEECREDYKLFKSFEYVELYEKRGGKGRKGVEKIAFKFELTDKIINNLMTKTEKIEKELDKEDWILIELRILIDKNKEREKYFNTVNIHAIYSLVNYNIERLKETYDIPGTLDPKIISSALNMAFKNYKRYPNNPKPFEEFLWGAFEKVYLAKLETAT